MARVFGAINGAGTQIRERVGAQAEQAAAYGQVAVTGAFRSGPVGSIVTLASLAEYRRIYGGLTQDSQAPLAVEDYYRHGRGAGAVHVLRVTDGSEVASRLVLRDRNVDLSVIERTPATKVAATLATLRAHNGGRWGGRRAVAAGDVSLPSALGAGNTTVTTGVAMLKNQWAGAILRFHADDPSTEYVVESNTTAGVLTLRGAVSSLVSGGSDGRYILELRNVHEVTGGLEALAVVVEDGGEAPATAFGLQVYRDGTPVAAWSDVALDPDGDAYWRAAIVDDPSNYEIASFVDGRVGDPADPLKRPANYAEIPAPGSSVTATTVKFQTVRWTRTSGGSGNPYLDTVNDVTWGSDPRPVTIVLTWTGATTATVAATFDDGSTAANLPNLTLGTAYASQHPWLPGFTVRSGGTAPDAADTLTIVARPLPADLAGKGAWFYPAASAASGDVRVRHRVVSNTRDTITLPAGTDVTASVTAPGAPTLTVDNAGPYDFSGSNLTLQLTLPGETEITLTEGSSSSTLSATAAAAALQALELARAGSAAAQIVSFGVSADDKLTITALQAFGPAASITVGNGTLNSVLGLTNGEVSAAGATPTIGRLEYREELGGGYDGIADIASADYEAAFVVGASPWDAALALDTGVLTHLLPGVTLAAAQRAMIAYAATTNAVAIAEIPDTTLTEAAATAWVASNLSGAGEALDYLAVRWPSYGLRPNPYGRGRYTCTMSGAFAGVAARRALEQRGPHIAQAGPDYDIGSSFVALPTGERRLDNEVLNRAGLIEVRQRGAAVYPFGDRTIGYRARGWLHQRLALSHIGRSLQVRGESLVFRSINDVTLLRARSLVRDLLEPWFAAGWFDDVAGVAFEDQVQITADASNNPASTRAAGDLHVDVALQIVGTAERVIFTIGPSGLTEA